MDVGATARGTAVGAPERLRDELTSKRLIVAPAVPNAFSTKLAALAGFPVGVTGGSLFSNALLGLPDAGYLTLTETEFLLSRMARVSPIPVICDVDTGYGNALMMMHTMRVIEGTGAAGLIVEDQVAPKRSGYLAGKQLISTEGMVGKIHAALDARRDTDFMLAVRTDAHGVEGIDTAIERANLYAEAGADCLFVEGLHSLEDLRRIGGEIVCEQKMTNLTYFRNSSTEASAIPDRHEKPQLSYEELHAMGFTIALVGSQPLRVASLAIYRYYERLQVDGIGAVVAAGDDMIGTPFADWHSLTGYDEIAEL